VPKLKQAIRDASPSVKVLAFNQARNTRNTSEKGDRALIERTVPVFEALIESDTGNVFHRNHAQLGYALQAQNGPDLPRAERAFTTAIRIRGDWREAGWPWYELARAICRILLDADFKAKRPSSPAAREAIVADLWVGAHSEADEMFADARLREWLDVNALTLKELRETQR
jgi:hypothetical protein